MMICTACKLEKPTTNFPVKKGKLINGSRQRQTICRKCKNEANWAKGACQCGRPLVTKTLCQVCRERNQRLAVKNRDTLKRNAIDNYGGKCVFCDEKRLLFLTIDHIEDNGAEHRKRVGINTGSATYRWLRQNGYPAGFQIACFNCNAAKARIGAAALVEYLKDNDAV